MKEGGGGESPAGTKRSQGDKKKNPPSGEGRKKKHAIVVKGEKNLLTVRGRDQKYRETRSRTPKARKERG